VVKHYSDLVRVGKSIDVKIPHVGRLTIKNNIAGVIFDKELLEECRGSTAKNF
jgi:hypothetical protein